MRQLVRIIGLILATILIIIGILSLFIHLYFTPEKLKNIITVQAEKALHTKVEIGSVDIGLFKGIVVKDLHIKQPNTDKDISSLKRFVLYYKFWPLLHGQLDISNIELDSPYLFIIRDKAGNINLTYLQKKEKPKAIETKNIAKPNNVKKGLPLILAIKQIIIKNANVYFKDLQKKIPDIHVISNSKIVLNNLNFKENQLNYKGNITLDAKAIIKDKISKLNLKGNFNTQKIDINSSVDLEKQVVNLYIDAFNYLTQPKINMNMNRKELDINKLIAFFNAIAPKTKKTKINSKKNLSKNNKLQKNNLSNTNNLIISGKINIDKVLYNKLIISKVFGKFKSYNNKLTINPLSCYIANGKVHTSLEVKNQKNLNGSLDIKQLDLGILLNQLAVKHADNVKGNLDLSLLYNAVGTDIEQIKNSLNADGKYSITDLSLRKTPILLSLEQFLHTKKLSDITFKKAAGNLHIKHGKVFIDGLWTSDKLKLRLKGKVGFDKSIYMPVELYLPTRYIQKIRLSKSITKFLQNKNGQTKINLIIKGSIDKPQIALSSKTVNQTIKKGIENLLYKYIR